MAKVLDIKAKVLRSLESDIAVYFDLKEQLEELKERIIEEMEDNNIREVKSTSHVATLEEVQKSEVDPKSFYDSLDKRTKKKFFEMVNVVKSKAKKFVGEEQIEDNSFLTSTYNRFTVKRVRKLKRRRR